MRRECARLMHDARETFLRELVPALAGAGIDLVDWEALDGDERRSAKAYFDEKVFPVLTPLAVDPSRPFPHISNLSLNLAATVRAAEGRDHFARVKVPGRLPQWVLVSHLPGAGARRHGFS